MRGVVRRPVRLRPASAGRHGLPLALAALAVVAAASTAASGVAATADPPVVAAGTMLPPVVPPTYGYSGVPTTPAMPGPPGSSGRVPGDAATGQAAPALAANGIPQRALTAYQAAATASDCGVPWSLLAAIGRVESNHGRFGGATLLADGRSDPPIIGIPLDGRPGVAKIGDTDGGKYDADGTYDRAVGPMQFIPGTWALFATDGDGDGRTDPHDLDDAAAAAADYLCRAGGDLRTEAGQRDAVFSYNRSDSYVRLVLDLADEYERGAPVDELPPPDRTPRPLPPVTAPTLPPVTVGPPPAASPTTPKPPPQPTPTTPKPTPTPTTPAPTTPAPTTPAPPTPPTTTPPPSCTPAPTPTGTPTGSPTGTPTAIPSPTPAVTPGPTTTPTPTPTVTPGLTTTPAPTPTGTSTATPTPTPTPCPTP